MQRAFLRRRTRWVRFLNACVWLYILGLSGIAFILEGLSDEWWVGTVLLFAPRWVWGLPFVLLLPLAFFFYRVALLPLGCALLLFVGSMMDFELPSFAVLENDDERSDLRVMTYNIGGGVRREELAGLVDEIGADVAVFQECESILDKAALEAKGFHVDAVWGSCIASRYPIRKVDARDPKDMWQVNGSGVIVRYEIETPGRLIHVMNVHLATVREGLSQVMHRGWKGAEAIEASIAQRSTESGLARAWAARANPPREKGKDAAPPEAPLLVMGDFNMPIESAIYKRFWSPFKNAFSEAGYGFGVTKATRWHGIRIDHVLLGPGWFCPRAWVGPNLGGDHRPMVADLRYQGGA